MLSQAMYQNWMFHLILCNCQFNQINFSAYNTKVFLSTKPLSIVYCRGWKQEQPWKYRNCVSYNMIIPGYLENKYSVLQHEISYIRNIEYNNCNINVCIFPEWRMIETKDNLPKLDWTMVPLWQNYVIRIICTI